MAMDKDRLLQYFQQHYLSRQEVLFKLPLNVSIDTFWPELLNRRKAGATILPLSNASGMPYWYVLTEKMIAASERLCAEAMEQEECFDPYRAPMTSAMTEEMFFTSFVEGAQIPLQEAMDFLQRGTEPENIQEQMIWNNRHAWSGMIGSLYRPLDEGFVKSLAFMLTEEMDNCAEDYRQTDQHPIAAMNSEPYEVPSAYSLPGRMTEYYAFLQSGSVHPLIKAAVGQAYILVARPFPEGNERLSRMISSAVLLRSGYDFFRDISISSVIAKESYRYYKCMQEILRTENGGDLTYFMEYYLDLLVRALDSKKERELRRAQETLAREREMAREPLRSPEPPPPAEEQEADDEETKELQEDYPRVAKPWPIQSADKFMEQVRKFKYSPKSSHREYPVKVQRMLDQGLPRFSVSQWSQIQGISRKDADYECRVLYQKGLTDRHLDVTPMEYSFRIASENKTTPEHEEESEVEAQSKAANESPPVIPASFEKKLKLFEQSQYIVDYMDLFRNIQSAVHDYTTEAFDGFDPEDVEGLIKDRYDEAKSEMTSSLEALKDLLAGVPAPQADADYIEFFCGALSETDERRARRDTLYALTASLTRSFASCCNKLVSDYGYTEKQVAGLREEISGYNRIKEMIKLASCDYIDQKPYEADMRYILDTYIRADDSKLVNRMADMSLVELLLEGKTTTPADLVKDLPGDDTAKAETIENNLKHEIVKKMSSNEVYFGKLSEMLEDVIQQRKIEAMSYEEYLRQVVELAQAILHPEQDDAYPEGIRDSEARRALYDFLDGNSDLTFKEDHAIQVSVRSHWQEHPQRSQAVQQAIYKTLIAAAVPADEAMEKTNAIFDLAKRQAEYDRE